MTTIDSPNPTSPSDPIPLVIVQGFLGTALLSWPPHLDSLGTTKPPKRRKVIVPSLGPVSSLHDRACELYYSLVGGKVDYGVLHSYEHQHARYGRTYPEGLYPQWSKEHPLHFLGHSIGGPTVVKMQDLLHAGHFAEGHPDMVRSLNAVCAPFRGTPLVYTLGTRLTAAPDVRPFSIGAFLAKMVHVVAYISPLLPTIWDIHADGRALSYRECSILTFGKQLWKSDWAASRDAAPYDVTFAAFDLRENDDEGRPYPNTFYRSHISRMTCRINSSTEYQHKPVLSLSSFSHNLLYFWSRSIGSFNYRSLQPPPSFMSNLPGMPTEEMWANDGVVPVFSQWHPLACETTTCEHYEIDRASPLEGPMKYLEPTHDTLTPGRWHVLAADQRNHFSLIPFLIRQNGHQQTFWIEYAYWLSSVDTRMY